MHSIQQALNASAPGPPPSSSLCAEKRCREHQGSRLNVRKRGREASGPMEREQERSSPDATAAEQSTVEHAASHACGDNGVQHDKGSGKSPHDGSQDDNVRGSSDEEKLWQPSIIGLRSMVKTSISSRPAACLRTAVTEHLRLYKHETLSATQEQLEEAQRQCKRVRYRDEHWRAVLAASTLVLQEKRILHEAVEALEKP